MKKRISILLLIMFLPLVAWCQEINPQTLKGSWLGKVNTGNESLRLMIRFQLKNNSMKGLLDSPDQGLKNIPFEKVWTLKDSVFARIPDFTVFKGVMMPGDSVIDGKWAGVLALKLRKTEIAISFITRTDPKFDGYKIIKLIETTPIKDQQATGACWCFATTSFIETEAIRLGKKPVILSPMFFVTPTYIDKAEKYIRMSGKTAFDEGDLTFSALGAYRRFGALPQSVYSGQGTDSAYDHTFMNDELLEKVKYYQNSGRGTMTIDRIRKDIDSIQSETMGKAPESFTYNNKQYTPKSFASEMVGIDPANYVEITSFTHHPFYSKFILEIPSNWNNNYYLNLPLNDFVTTLDYALMHNYSAGWDGDIYEGYDNGFAVLNDSTKITQKMRQDAFDNHTTSDVHNMHIVGIAENSKGKQYYVVKNSSDNKNSGGYMYMSKEFLMKKTISLLINKDAIPKEIKNKIKSVL